VHSTQEDNQNQISITERPLNYYNRQFEFIKDNFDDVQIIKYFHKTRIKISYKEMTDSPAKDIIKEYFCTKKSVIYFPDEIDFQIFQNAYIQIMSPDSFTKTMKTSRKLIDIQTYAQFKEIILKTHKELLHPGIDKLTLQFKELYYYPDF